MACFDIAVDLGTPIKATGVVSKITSEVVPTEAAELINTQANAISDTYAVAETKGATMPSEQTAENLAETVESIEAAGALTQYVAETYDVAETKGATMPATRNAENLPGTVESIETITSEVEEELNTLKSASQLYFRTIPEENLTIRLPDMPYLQFLASAFQNNTNIKTLKIFAKNLPRVTNMSGMFSSCSSLTSVDLSNFDTSNVTSMAYMFQSCSSLTSIDLSNFDTSNVTSMSGMFSRCTSLVSIDLSTLDVSKVTNSGSMLYNTGLTELAIPNGLVTIGDHFCSQSFSLEIIIIPASVTTINDVAFGYLSSLKELHCQATTPPTINGTNVFINFPSSAVIYVPSGTLEAYQTADGWGNYADQIQEEP